MPATTTSAAVQKIIKYDATVITDVQAFIDTAILIADAVIGDALSNTALEVVTRYLTAHLISITDNSTRVNSEQVKSLQSSYQSKLSDGLGITHWGNMAKFLDTSGKLAAYDRRVIDGITSWSLAWVGKDAG